MAPHLHPGAGARGGEPPPIQKSTVKQPNTTDPPTDPLPPRPDLPFEGLHNGSTAALEEIQSGLVQVSAKACADVPGAVAGSSEDNTGVAVEEELILAELVRDIKQLLQLQWPAGEDSNAQVRKKETAEAAGKASEAAEKAFPPAHSSHGDEIHQGQRCAAQRPQPDLEREAADGPGFSNAQSSKEPDSMPRDEVAEVAGKAFTAEQSLHGQDLHSGMKHSIQLQLHLGGEEEAERKNSNTQARKMVTTGQQAKSPEAAGKAPTDAHSTQRAKPFPGDAGSIHCPQPDLGRDAATSQSPKLKSTTAKDRRRYTREEKGKQSNQHSNQAPIPDSTTNVGSTSEIQLSETQDKNRKSGRLFVQSPLPVINEEKWSDVKAKYWWRRERKDRSSSDGGALHTMSIQGTQRFKQHAYGKCFNCFATDHQVRHCNAATRCWKCGGKEHHAYSCFKKPLRTEYKQPATRPGAPQSHQAHTPLPPPINHSNTSTRTACRSYLEVTLGGKEGAEMAAYPGDPRVRPANSSVFVAATGDIRRRRDALAGRTAVCRLQGSYHDTETYHVGDLLRSKMGMSFIDFQVVKHFPEQYLVIFSSERLRQRVTRQSPIEDGGRVFHFTTWRDNREAEDVNLMYRVFLRIEGIPPHAWSREVAQLVLGNSCAIHCVEEHTRRRQRTRTYDAWAWCADPCKIPKRVWLTITDPDCEQPPTDIPLPQVQVYHDDPTGIKHAQKFTVLPHLEVVEDLSVLAAAGRGAGDVHRRFFTWRYGELDSIGEDRGRGGADRGREVHRRRDDEDEDGHRGGHRRHRSSSAWGRATRCRNGAADCYSSNIRTFTNRYGGSYRSRGLKWEPKKLKADAKVAPTPASKSKTKKSVSFADPIASLLGPSTKVACSEAVQTTLVTGVAEAGKNMEEQVTLALKTTTINNAAAHLDKPLNKPEMEALLELVEHGNNMNKKGGINKQAAKEMKVA